jgi:hypothetical protein
MKQCRYCKKIYPESHFGVALTTPDKIYRRHKCRSCYRATKNKLRKNNRDWLTDYKKKSKCDKCGINDYRVLEFHHLNIVEKDFAISWAYNNIGLEKIKKEIEKCVILCANCHRIIHWQKNI